MTHICVISDNGLSPDWPQAIIWINTGILLTGTLEQSSKRNSNIFIQENVFENVWKMCPPPFFLSRLQSVKVSQGMRYICKSIYIPNGKINILRTRQDGRHFAFGILKYIFLNEDFWISNKSSSKYVPWGPTGNMSTLVQIMVWCRTGDKPLSDPIMTQFADAYMHHPTSMSSQNLNIR